MPPSEVNQPNPNHPNEPTFQPGGAVASARVASDNSNPPTRAEFAALMDRVAGIETSVTKLQADVAAIVGSEPPADVPSREEFDALVSRADVLEVGVADLRTAVDNIINPPA